MPEGHTWRTSARLQEVERKSHLKIYRERSGELDFYPEGDGRLPEIISRKAKQCVPRSRCEEAWPLQRSNSEEQSPSFTMYALLTSTYNRALKAHSHLLYGFPLDPDKIAHLLVKTTSRRKLAGWKPGSLKCPSIPNDSPPFHPRVKQRASFYTKYWLPLL